MARTEKPAAQEKVRSREPKPGHMPISELAADRPGAPSPFGDDQTFPLPVDRLTYHRSDSGH
ncbi:hypothetical protein [Catenuloplanes indicus]|uniref:Uncharacterized protein n=1 Tax=Catenuloplanes indicus TaxID=137267 RepID=A0AAE4AYI3_9ACTN|nr:hypothetical protein [Catenuloplanes indicus]MDQ0367337.1 hypothetical protein [Catenuloplanes indicus]